MNLHIRPVCLIILVSLFLTGTALATDYVVAGAPNAGANGLYVEDGTSDGVAKYTKGDFTLERRDTGMDKLWIISLSGSTAYSNSPNYSPLPPNDGQWMESPSGDPVPGLTITLAPSNIPSLGTWGALIMLTLLLGIAIVVIRKNRSPDTGARA